jgi:hypothetical protein
MTRYAAAALFAVACAAGSPGDELDEEELPVGELSADDAKFDGQWGAATTCKAIPDLPQLPHPEITISLHGLTLHLVDRTVGFDKVFPIGPGAIDLDPGSMTFGESLSMYPLMAYGKQDFTITPAGTTECRIWWTDPATGQKLPVFAGMPFMRWSGAYAIHGPVDNFRAANGGSLRRGFVSHGCIRMQSADVLELYARIRGIASVPVHVQREPERREDGARVDLVEPWIGSECDSDFDCTYTNGFCHTNAWSGRGFCSARCTSYCADKPGSPTTLCVNDPQAPGQGMCVAKHQAENHDCRPYDHFVPAVLPRRNSTTTAKVCVPGSPGWVGDRCLANADCQDGTHCSAGICTMACDRYCDDQPGYADTFCAAAATPGGQGTCLRRCTAATNAPECAADQECVDVPRNNQPGMIRSVCLPQ